MLEDDQVATAGNVGVLKPEFSTWELERERYLAEIDRIRSEAEKLRLERAVIEKELKTSPWRGSEFLKVFAAGVILVPLVWFYVEKVVSPMLQTENIELGLENAKNRRELEEEREKFRESQRMAQSEKEYLEKEKGQLKLQKEQLERETASLQDARESLVKKVVELKNTNKITEEERDRLRNELQDANYAGELRKAKEENASLKTDNEILQSEISRLSSQVDSLESRLGGPTESTTQDRSSKGRVLFLPDMYMLETYCFKLGGHIEDPGFGSTAKCITPDGKVIAEARSKSF